MSFFQFTLTSDYFVMIRDDDSISGLLRNDVEIIVFAHDGLAHKCSREDISGLMTHGKETN